MFNQGLPEQFSFVTTFRHSRNGGRRRWHLIRITDSRGQPQFAVGLDPNRKTVEFSIKKYDGSLQTLSWERPQVSTYRESCMKTFLLGSENPLQNVSLPTLKLHCGAIFQPAIFKTWQELFYPTNVMEQKNVTQHLYLFIFSCFKVFSDECGEWQKIHFGVFRDKVLLYTNCQRVGEKPLEYVDAREGIDASLIYSIGSTEFPIPNGWVKKY